MNIVVLAGGISTERDVSFSSGKMVTKALRNKGHNVIMIDVFLGLKNGNENLEDAFERCESLSVNVKEITDKAPDIEAIKALRKGDSKDFFGPGVIMLCKMADVVFLALHGENGENGKVQAALDLFGIKYTGTDYLSSAIAMNKSMAKKFFEMNNVPTPKGTTVYKNEDAYENALKIGFPCVVKPCSGGSSIGVYIINNEKELKEGLEASFKYDDVAIVEEYVKGREFSVGVIGRRVLPVIEMAPIEGFYDYKNKYKAGSTIETCPANLSDEITKQMQDYTLKAFDALGLTAYARMDFLMDANNNMYCLEANTLPGMTPTSLLPQEAQAVGISFDDLCQMLIDISLNA
ncbi:D-alanine-D-alanine ligase [Acetitomaculum ruminis DSM 5522]|uniref:D-alanine--D-alanine ligase n=1 Tax=Acetitomaculum ruminis DSM 5522 TaxID=1120918 RepID=A0A1I0YCI8_9FIRM|nr:D-alanine--D-alanine ligase [Acetitomaculum ruminis]SFB10517.1 D-alanine-D-alanine ligase [Acetitomaculum ruminis DSM 5522]